jgi:hypothetical protein
MFWRANQTLAAAAAGEPRGHGGFVSRLKPARGMLLTIACLDLSDAQLSKAHPPGGNPHSREPEPSESDSIRAPILITNASLDWYVFTQELSLYRGWSSIVLPLNASPCELLTSPTLGRWLLADLGKPQEEPSAGKPPARICEGEAEWLNYSTTTT